MFSQTYTYNNSTNESSMGNLQALLDSHRGCMFVISGDWNVDKDGCYAARTCVQRFCSANNLCWLDPTHNSVRFSFCYGV